MHPASLTAMRPSRASSDDIGAMRPRSPAPRPSAPTASGPARASCHRRSEMSKFWLAQGTRLRSGKRTGCAWWSVPAQRRQAREVGIRCRLRRIRPCRSLRRRRLRTQNARRVRRGGWRVCVPGALQAYRKGVRRRPLHRAHSPSVNHHRLPAATAMFSHGHSQIGLRRVVPHGRRR